ncbi:MAG: DsbA family protein [Candidatus Rifleibacteriota bacterium]
MQIDFSNPDLLFYFSFQCPYSYMAWEILKNLLAKESVKVAPIEIGLFPPGNNSLHYRKKWGKNRWERLTEDAAKLGLKLKKPEAYVSELYVSSAVEAYDSSSAIDYISSVFRAFFAAEINISAPKSLKVHLQSEGIDTNIFSEATADKKLTKKAEEKQLLWGTRRIRQVPTVEYNDERYSGFIDKGGIERFLRGLVE